MDALTEEFKVDSLELDNTIEVVRQLRKISDHDVILNFERMYRVQPMGMVYFIAAVEEMKSRGYSFEYNPRDSYWDSEKAYAISYAKSMGFFKALGIPEGQGVGTYRGSSTYCPPTKITMAQLLTPQNSVFQDGIVAEADNLAQVLTRNIPNALSTMSYLIREIMRNTFEHTTIDHLWVAAQSQPKKNRIEVAIVDNGEGVRQVLSVNNELANKIKTDKLALCYAIKPGISGNAKYSKHEGVWANSGFGLYVTSEILSRLGSFTLISGQACLRYEDQNIETSSADFHGTAVRLFFNTEKMINLPDSFIEDIVKMGEKKAQTDTLAVSYASKSSKMQ